MKNKVTFEPTLRAVYIAVKFQVIRSAYADWLLEKELLDEHIT